MKVKQVIEFLSKQDPEARITQLRYCTDEDQWIWDSFHIDNENFIFDELYWNYTSDELDEKLEREAYEKDVENEDEEELDHLGCHNWPNCDLYGCGN